MPGRLYSKGGTACLDVQQHAWLKIIKLTHLQGLGSFKSRSKKSSHFFFFPFWKAGEERIRFARCTRARRRPNRTCGSDKPCLITSKAWWGNKIVTQSHNYICPLLRTLWLADLAVCVLKYGPRFSWTQFPGDIIKIVLTSFSWSVPV